MGSQLVLALPEPAPKFGHGGARPDAGRPTKKGATKPHAPTSPRKDRPVHVRQHSPDQPSPAPAPARSRVFADPCSSAASFDGWSEEVVVVETETEPWREVRPRTWLLRTGWKRYGPISPYDTPGCRRRRA